MVAAVPLVPPTVQHAIAHRTALYAYVPTRVAARYRYAHWTFTPSARPALRIWFRNPAGREWTFVASPRAGRCDRGKEKTFQLAGNTVYWRHTATEQQAWRCVTGANGKPVQLTAATSQPPTQFADVGLGTIVASARRIR